MKVVNTGRPGYVIIFSAVVAGVFTSAIMALHVATQGQVERNERLLEDKALVELFGLGETAELTGEQVRDLVDRRIVKLDAELTDLSRIHDKLDMVAYTRAETLIEAHERYRKVLGGSRFKTVVVASILPRDLDILVPVASRTVP